MELLLKKHCFKAVQAGFTLLELLVVIALLAVITSLAVAAYDSDADDSIAISLAQSEMAEMAKALRQFKRDVGVYPQTSDPQISPMLEFHPADMSQLFVFLDEEENASGNPTSDGLDDVGGYRRFNPDTGRGWRGPYLEQRGVGCASFTGAPNIPNGIVAFAKMDPFHRGYATPGFGWHEYDASNQCQLGGTRLAGRQGGAYLLLDMDKRACVAEGLDAGLNLVQATARSNDPRLCHPRVVSTGPDGIYGGANATDVCQPNRSVAAGKDDLVMCL